MRNKRQTIAGSACTDGPTIGRGLIVISGPSGAGKTTVCRELNKRLGLRISVSLTTRPRRPGETDGTDYHFVTEEEFRRRMAEGRLVEWAEVFGRLYGTPVEEVMRAADSGEPLLLEIDVQGGIQVKRKYPDALAVLLLPPDDAALLKRLSKRGTESPEEIERRLAEAQAEIDLARRSGCYNVEIVNDDLEETVRKAVETIETRRNTK